MAMSYGPNGAVYDWWDPGAALTCTNEHDNWNAYWSFNNNWGYGYNGPAVLYSPGNMAYVWNGLMELNDRGMCGALGLGTYDIRRDNIYSRWGNWSAKAFVHCTKASNATGSPDNVFTCQEYTGHVTKETMCNFEWRNFWRVDWGPMGWGGLAYAWLSFHNCTIELRHWPSGRAISSGTCSWPTPQKGIKLDGDSNYPNGGYNNGKAINLGSALYNCVISSITWPRLYWNKRGYACPDNNDIYSKAEPEGHNADGVMGHTKVWLHATMGIEGSGPRLGHEYGSTHTFDAIIYIPDIGYGGGGYNYWGSTVGWLYSPGGGGGTSSGVAAPWISAGAVTETTIALTYGASMPHINNMLGYADNEIGRYRVIGSRTNGWTNLWPSQSGSSSWTPSGLTPDTVYCFQTQAQSNPDQYGDRAYAYSGRVCRRTMAKPGAPQNNQYSKWDTPRVNVVCPYWGNDIAYPTDAANITQVVDYVFNQSPTDTSGYSTTGRVGGNVVIQAPWHSTGQNSGFWVHTRTRNNWGVSPWVHTWFETVDRLYRPGERRQSNWRSHQASGGKSHRFTGSWTEMTTRSEFRPDGVTEHPNDDPTARSGDKIHPEDPNKWRNQDLIGAEATWYPEVDFYP